MILMELKSFEAAKHCKSHVDVAIFFNEVQERVDFLGTDIVEAELIRAIIFLSIQVEPDRLHRVVRAALALPFNIK